MRRILAGIETEYGLHIENRGAENQIEDSQALVRSYPGKRFVGWDYRFEHPRNDLRGFKAGHLAHDPVDAKFDSGHPHAPDAEIRSDRMLPNGARFYNDHGHPEYATPECWSLKELVLQDLAGEHVVRAALRAYAESERLAVRAYKNNTDFHGASYGCHESYLVPREVGFERLYRAVTPMLIARQVLCGSGKVGSESGRSCVFQISQRADFFTTESSVDTLYRRPIFNTRDEPHADAQSWIRLHVISGDANMSPSSTFRKVGLIKLALWLEDAREAPQWQIQSPVQAMQSVSRDESYDFRIDLDGGSWTTAYEILESYFAAAESTLGVTGAAQGDEGECWALIVSCRQLLADLRDCPERFARSVDWAAKRAMLEEFMNAEGWDWRHKDLPSFDLAYHDLDSEDGLYFALEQMGRVEPRPLEDLVLPRVDRSFEPTRALARGTAAGRFPDHIKAVSWGNIEIEDGGGTAHRIALAPDRNYPVALEAVPDVKSYIELLRGT